MAVSAYPKITPEIAVRSSGCGREPVLLYRPVREEARYTSHADT